MVRPLLMRFTGPWGSLIKKNLFKKKLFKIAEKTVKVHRGRIMEKLQAGSVAELVRLSEKAGIKPLDREVH